ncbi:hypothetical protein L195_g014357 [Trifolium pratense]|uniref:Retrovirus-related Pol polyprotein from transposon TNT 1-94 n=1 Tax=Trifolium pratense TaxID=57577 RepID=A0A2K3PQP0_TRIPR|nr:hypothetical protein L195_g014357 [Trifolium pratense]
MSSYVLQDQIPHTILNLEHDLYPIPLRVFDCTCFVHDLSSDVRVIPHIVPAPIDSPTPSHTPTPPPLSTSPAPEHPITLRKGIWFRHPKPKYACVLNYDRLSTSYVSFVSTLDYVSIPKSKGEAMTDTNWRQAMVEEMAA